MTIKRRKHQSSLEYWSEYWCHTASRTMINPFSFILTKDSTLATVRKKLFTHEDKENFHKTFGVLRFVLPFAFTTTTTTTTTTSSPCTEPSTPGLIDQRRNEITK